MVFLTSLNLNKYVFNKMEFQEVKPTPTMKIDRNNDEIYETTMQVVRAVLEANHNILKAKSSQILEYVKVDT